MANNIYIGARYVPVFANPVEWDNLRSYEPLTIVTYQGTSYTSKKTVPVGVTLNNTDYWVATGNYNAQVEQYRQDVEDYKNEFDAFKTSQQTINTAVSESIQNINNELDSLTARKYIFISDSYGDTRENTTWFNELISILGLSSTDYYETHQGGYGFAPTFSTSATFLNLLTALSASVTNKTEITDIIIVGGFNDSKQTVDNIKLAISQFMTYVKTNYPNAKVWIGAFGWSFNSEFVEELYHGRYTSAYKDCGIYGANFIGGSDYCMHNKNKFMQEAQSPYILALGYQYVHPNASGSKCIAGCIANAILGGSGKTTGTFENITLNLSSGVSAVTIPQIRQWQNDNVVTWENNQFILNIPSTTFNYGANAVEIGTLNNGYVAGGISIGAIIQCGGFIAANNSNINCPINLFIRGNKLYAYALVDGITTTNIAIFYNQAQLNIYDC